MSHKKYIIITGVILITVLFGVFSHITKTAKVEYVRVFQKEQNDADIDTSQWKTYENNEYGYRISYPRDWDIYLQNDDKIPFPQSIRKNILDFLSLFIIVSPDYPPHTIRHSTLYIAKDCGMDKPKKVNALCPHSIVMSTHEPIGMPCAKDKATQGQLPVTVSDAFHNIFSLKEGEVRDSLQYSTESSCFVYDDVPMCIYKFINDAIYFDDESCYNISIKDSTKERKYLETEKAILDSLTVMKKTH